LINHSTNCSYFHHTSPLHFDELCKNHHRRRSTSANPNIAPTLSLPPTPITKYYHHPQRSLQTPSQHPPPSIELCKLHIMELLLERVQAAICALAKLSLHSKPANPFLTPHFHRSSQPRSHTSTAFKTATSLSVRRDALSRPSPHVHFRAFPLGTGLDSGSLRVLFQSLSLRVGHWIKCWQLESPLGLNALMGCQANYIP
jgi:hypothetical protein